VSYELLYSVAILQRKLLSLKALSPYVSSYMAIAETGCQMSLVLIF
jgi:hypothetical protein